MSYDLEIDIYLGLMFGGDGESKNEDGEDKEESED